MADGSARVSFKWGDAEYEFRLGLGQIRILQERAGAGPYAVYRRIAAGNWMVDDLRETIRLGLIGGGLEPVKALNLVEHYFDERPLQESVTPALAILGVALVGPEDDPLGKQKAATESPKPPQKSPSQTSTAPALQ